MRIFTLAAPSCLPWASSAGLVQVRVTEVPLRLFFDREMLTQPHPVASIYYPAGMDGGEALAIVKDICEQIFQTKNNLRFLPNGTGAAYFRWE